MSSRLPANEAFLRLVGSKSTSPKQRREVLRTASNEQVKSLCECAYNILKRNVPVTPAQLQDLRRHKKLMYMLADRSVPVDAKRRRIQQRGGFIVALLRPIASALLGALLSAGSGGR